MKSNSSKTCRDAQALTLASHEDFEEALLAAKQASHKVARRKNKEESRKRATKRIQAPCPEAAHANKSEIRKQSMALWEAVSNARLDQAAQAFCVGIRMPMKKMTKALEEHSHDLESASWFSGPESFQRGGLFRALDTAMWCGYGARRVEQAAMLLDRGGVALGYSDLDLIALAEKPLADAADEADAARERRRRGLKTWARMWGRLTASSRKALLRVCGNWLAEPFEVGGIEHGDWREAVARQGELAGLAGRVLMMGQCAEAFGQSLTAQQWRSVLEEISSAPNDLDAYDGEALALGFRHGLRKSLRLALSAPGEDLDVESARMLAAIAVESDDIKLLGLVFKRSSGVDGLAPSRWWRFVAEAEWMSHGDNREVNYRVCKNGEGGAVWEEYAGEAEAWGGSHPLSLVHLALVNGGCNRGGRKCFDALVQIPQMLMDAINNPCPRIIAMRKTWEIGWLVKTFPGLAAKEPCGLGIGHYWIARWLDDTSLRFSDFKRAAKSSWARHLLEPMPAGLRPAGLMGMEEVEDGEEPFESAKRVLDDHDGKWIEKQRSKVERAEIAAGVDSFEPLNAPRRSMRL